MYICINRVNRYLVVVAMVQEISKKQSFLGYIFYLRSFVIRDRDVRHIFRHTVSFRTGKEVL